MLHEPRVEAQIVERRLIQQSGFQHDDRTDRRNVAVRLARADPRAHVEDEAFAHGIDRRVGDLRELLAQVRGDGHAAFEERQRGIVAHRQDGFARARGDDADDVLEFVLAHPEAHEVAIDRRVGGRPRVDGFGQRKFPRFDDRAEVGAMPAFVAELFGRDELVRGEADHQPIAGAEPAALYDLVAAEIDDAGFRRREHFARRRAAPAQRPEPAAVERRADRVAVGENDGGRTVPRFDGRDVRVVVGAQPIVRRFDRGREHYVDGFVDAIAGAEHRVDGRVEVQRIAGPRAHRHAARLHPRPVPGDRVDLTVVRDVVERLHQPPLR